tara:strand:- start:25069 stop:25923 length:855 start_codon:yes stop_codon:yes gene_type:complete
MKKIFRINAISDLHLEFEDKNNLPQFKFSENLDFLILAGDIITSSRKSVPKYYTDWILELQKYAKHVIYVPGNHEYYNSRRDKFARIVRERFKNTNVHFLLNESVVLEGIRFVGTDLWTDAKLDAQHENSLLIREQDVKLRLTKNNDFKNITVKKNGFRKLSFVDRLHWHYEAKNFILRELNNSSEPVILITHHGISKEQLSPEKYTSNTNYFYVSDIVDEILDTKNPPIYHFSGHNHQFKKGNLKGKLPFLINSRGYNDVNEKTGESYLISEYKSDYLVELKL